MTKMDIILYLTFNLCVWVILVDGFVLEGLENDLQPEVSSSPSLPSGTTTEASTTTSLDHSMEAIREDLCNKESKKDGNESKRKTNRDYLIHILTDFTFSTKMSEQEWKKLFVRPLVAHLCKPKKWKLFGKLVVRLDEFDGNGDGKIDENEKNRIHSEMKTWTENGWKRKRKGRKDRKRKLRHQ